MPGAVLDGNGRPCAVGAFRRCRCLCCRRVSRSSNSLELASNPPSKHGCSAEWGYEPTTSQTTCPALPFPLTWQVPPGISKVYFILSVL